jgi:hypothetical protein
LRSPSPEKTISISAREVSTGASWITESSETNHPQKTGQAQEKIAKRVGRRNWSDQARPMMSGGTKIRCAFDGRREGIGCGGIGGILELARGAGASCRMPLHASFGIGSGITLSA